MGIVNGGNPLMEIAYYPGVLSVSFQVNHSSYGIVNSPDLFQLKIFRYSNGTIDGIFSGLVSDSTKVHHLITEGTVQNVKVE